MGTPHLNHNQPTKAFKARRATVQNLQSISLTRMAHRARATALEQLSCEIERAERAGASMQRVESQLQDLEARVDVLQRQQADAVQNRVADLRSLQSQRLEALRSRQEERVEHFISPALQRAAWNSVLNQRPATRSLNALLNRAEESLKRNRWAFLARGVELAYFYWGMTCLYACLLVARVFPRFGDYIGLQPRSDTAVGDGLGHHIHARDASDIAASGPK
jgi:hypothetical protein